MEVLLTDQKSLRRERFISTHYCRGFGCAYLAPCTQTEFYSRKWVRQTETTWAPETRYCQGPGLSDHFLQGRVYYWQKVPEPRETWSFGYYVAVQTDFYQVSSVFLIQSIQWLPKWHVQKSYCIWLYSVNFKRILVCLYSLPFFLYNILKFKHMIDNASLYKVNLKRVLGT